MDEGGKIVKEVLLEQLGTPAGGYDLYLRIVKKGKSYTVYTICGGLWGEKSFVEICVFGDNLSLPEAKKIFQDILRKYEDGEDIFNG